MIAVAFMHSSQAHAVIELLLKSALKDTNNPCCTHFYITEMVSSADQPFRNEHEVGGDDAQVIGPISANIDDVYA
jgi:hypothetical protein